MKVYLRSFNLYFAAALVWLVAGCASHGINPKKEASTMRLYLEGPPADFTTGNVLVTRQRIPMSIGREPFLTEADLSSAMLVDDPSGDGTFQIQLAFNEHGTLMLDMVTSANRGKHVVIFSQFPTPGKHKKEKKKDSDSDDDLILTPLPPTDSGATHTNAPRESAWLAAVLIRDRDTSGILRFTPDASRKEALRIVRGLHNVIAAEKKASHGF